MESGVARRDPTMTRPLTRRCRSGDQRGVALIFVLGAIALTAMVIVALLALSMTSARLASVQEQQTRERRAADGGLETGIGRLARSVSSNPCSDVPAGSAVSSPHERDASGDPIEVELRCRPLPLPMQTTPSTPSPEVLGGPGVEIVGPRYDGALSPGGGGIVDPSLVATGADPLRFDADVTVKQGADVRSTTAGVAGATVAGQYEQGVVGMGGVAGAPCGTLHPSAGSVQVSLSDRDQSPQCVTAGAQALTPRRGSLFSATETINSREAPPCDGSVIEFEPGRYNALETAKINNLFDGSCANRTFWFRTGKYLFDVNDASAATAPGAVAGDRYALIVDDPTAKIVFGEPSSWSAASGATADDFPRACDVARSGASIQLTSRSTIRHRQGRVAICPFFNPATDSPMPAVVQGESSPSQPILSSVTGLPTDRQLQASTLCAGWPFCDMNTRIRSFATMWQSAGTATLDSAVFLIQITERPPVHQARSYIRLRLRNPAAGIDCWVGHVVAGRTHRQYIAVDMMASTAAGQCGAALASRTEAVFEGATVNVELWVDEREPGACIGGCTITFDIGSIAMRTNMVGVPATTVTSVDWGTPQGALVRADGVVAVVPQPACPLPNENRCTYDTALTTRSISVGGFDPAASGIGDLEPVEHLGVRIESPDSGHSWASDEIDSTWVRVDLNLPANGTRPARTCSVTEPGFARSSRAVHVDLFRTGGECRPLVERAGELRGATVNVSIRSNCMWIGGAPAGQIDGRCVQVRLPEFDRIQLDVTPALVQRAPSALVSIDASAGASGSSFNVFGDALTPDLDLDLRWRGAVTELPVFGGVMSIRSLGSTQTAGATMGVVCCSPPPVTTLLLEAIIDSEVRAEAQLYVGRPGSAPPAAGTPPQQRRQVLVRDWTFCRNDCTQAQVAAPQVLGTSTVPASGG